ncbi:MAG: 50S ribosomal protein L1 [Microgenomates bacterium 39_6]|nr:MAG: 50S ribosomal protein L1 [Microgenomates bacterium 39_6]
MGQKKTAVVSGQNKKKAEKPEKEAKKSRLIENKTKNKPAKTEKKTKVRNNKKSPRYLKAKKIVNEKKEYSLKEAISLLKKTAWANFDEAAEAHLLIKKEQFSTRVKFPYDCGKERVIAIADDRKTMAKIESGEIDFDVLLSSPKVMPKLVAYARILGPRGLMPNPKEGTVTDDPQKKAKEIADLGVKIKTEKKAPLIHTVFGRASQKKGELEANLEELIRAIGRQNIKNLVISTTMGPGIKVDISD